LEALASDNVSSYRVHGLLIHQHVISVFWVLATSFFLGNLLLFTAKLGNVNGAVVKLNLFHKSFFLEVKEVFIFLL